MSMRRERLLAVLVLVTAASLTGVLGACAQAPVHAADDARPLPQDRDVITAQELADARIAGGTVLEAIQKLRPRFLNSGTPAYRRRDNGLTASIDGAAPVAVSELGSMSADDVTEIRYLSVAEAGFRFGVAARGGPVLLVTARVR